jgi:hypothetical protein
MNQNSFMTLVQLSVRSIEAFLILGVAIGVGRLVLRRWRRRFDSALAFHCMAGGIGMGILAHLTLGLGLAGLWNWSGFLPLGIALAAAAAVGYLPVRRVPAIAPDLAEPAAACESITPLAVLGLIALAILLAGFVARATLPPVDYDVLEYHLGGVQHWLGAGRIYPHPRLFYTALPFEVEMGYAVGCFVEGNPFLPAVPKLINLGLFLATLATLYAVAAHLTRNRAVRLLACLLFAAHPQTGIVARDALNDMGLTWYALLAVLAWLLWLRRRERIFFVLWAVFLGLTVCCKYTAVGLIVLPSALCLLPVAEFTAPAKSGTGWQPVEAGRRFSASLSKLRRLVLDGLLLGAIIAAVFAPWALKNALHYGNPVYPLLSGVFQTPTWSPEQTDFYLQAHGRTHPLHFAWWRALGRNAGLISPWLIGAMTIGCVIARTARPPLYPPRGRGGNQSPPLAGGIRGGEASSAIGSPVHAFPRLSPPSRSGLCVEGLAACALAGVVLITLAAHSFLPANPTRFLLPILPLAAILASRGIELAIDRSAALGAAAIAPFLLWIALAVAAVISPSTAGEPVQAFARIGLPVFADDQPLGARLAALGRPKPRIVAFADAVGIPVAASYQYINQSTPKNARIFVLYEARIAALRRSLAVGSVFDRSPLVDRAVGAQSGAELLDRLRREGFDFLYVNEFELRRLIGTYAPRPLFRDRAAQLGEPVDIALMPAWVDLYPPYLCDPRYAQCRRAIAEFVELCRRRAVWSMTPDYPYGIWIAALK